MVTDSSILIICYIINIGGVNIMVKLKTENLIGANRSDLNIPNLGLSSGTSGNANQGVSDIFQKAGKLINRETILAVAGAIAISITNGKVDAARADISKLQEQYNGLVTQLENNRSGLERTELAELKYLADQIKPFLDEYGDRLSKLEEGQEKLEKRITVLEENKLDFTGQPTLKQLVDKVFAQFEGYENTTTEPKEKFGQPVIYLFTSSPKKYVKKVGIRRKEKEFTDYERLNRKDVLDKFRSNEPVILTPFRWVANEFVGPKFAWHLVRDEEDKIFSEYPNITVENIEQLRRFAEDYL
jgi:uncharacterized protein (DUF433 family)